MESSTKRQGLDFFVQLMAGRDYTHFTSTVINHNACILYYFGGKLEFHLVLPAASAAADAHGAHGAAALAVAGDELAERRRAAVRVLLELKYYE